MREALHSGNFCLGIMHGELFFPNLVTLYKNSGYDYFLIDCEHGPMSFDQVGQLVAMARYAGVGVMVRIPEVRREWVLKVLDLGADALLAPMVASAETVRQLVDYAKYPPEGARGVSIHRPHSLYQPGNLDDYLMKANKRTALLVQIELRAALDALDDIASVPGLDALIVGPSDLSMDLGVFNQPDAPELLNAVSQTAVCAKNHGLASGIITSNDALLRFAVRQGMRILCRGSETRLLSDGLDANLAALREDCDG